LKELLQILGSGFFFIAGLITFFMVTDIEKKSLEQRARLAVPHRICIHNGGFKEPFSKIQGSLMIMGAKCNDGYVDGAVAWKISKQ